MCAWGVRGVHIIGHFREKNGTTCTCSYYCNDRDKNNNYNTPRCGRRQQTHTQRGDPTQMINSTQVSMMLRPTCNRRTLGGVVKDAHTMDRQKILLCGADIILNARHTESKQSLGDNGPSFSVSYC